MAPIIISLGHFCDKHGPRVVLVTQAGIKGSTGDELLLPTYPTDSYCKSCSLTFPDGDRNDVRSFKSNIASRSYVTTQYSSIRYQLLTLIVRRCFSEETMIYDGRPLVFYDDLRGFNLAIGFKLRDETARGNERRYCWILTIDSKNHNSSMKLLSEHWNFITSGFSKAIQYINETHDKESERQNKLHNENNIKLMEGTYLRGNKAKMPRNLCELTNDNLLFVRIHKWNAFILNSIMESHD
ncbi:hypothetical protein HG535_0F01790 [Zygotorulaspora mrakii]|uniref:UDENN FLCN/SMCR8-type domain-containing protein n=1 Tax=Zygotorulaspora mrakii TaxID=42260 RepID=A0A7H9B4Q2_ZYGMR|nr:uncharacterized protein HG535_0F01790 [Zygotorulaspora mrakii]QLG73668.1 hypothetical protein HG535_0F01790 [Zygotorulaspora mrakii]